MKKLHPTAAAVVCAGLLGAAAGCSDTKLAVPDDFCQTSVDHSALSPLLPGSGEVKQTHEDFESPRAGSACTLKVDGHLVLSVNALRSDGKPGPRDWKKVADTYRYAAERDVSFPGTAVIGSDRAVIEALCTKRSAYMSFAVYLYGDRVENTTTGYKKLQRFLDDFVPQVTKRFECTK
ncbi:hypothetical protein ACWDQO_26855 [Streptomyces sp. NPDC003703]|uniref:hypothetical protein n=1 Tax=Streptomyces sp. NPDC003283 TaxID=3364681 RepID=UPI0036CB43AE